MPTHQDPDARATRQPGARPRLTILFVEDDVLIRFAAADLLRGEGHEVIEAASGDEALSLVDASLEFDLLVSDIEMPGRTNGLQLIDLVAKRRPDLPVLVVSSLPPGSGDTELRFVQKPYSDEALLDAVQAAVGGNG